MCDGQRLAVFIQVIGIVGKPLSGSIGRSPDRQLARRHQATDRGLRAIQIPRLQVGVQPGEDPFESHVAAGRVANEGTVLRLVGRQVGVIGKSGAEKPSGLVQRVLVLQHRAVLQGQLDGSDLRVGNGSDRRSGVMTVVSRIGGPDEAVAGMNLGPLDPFNPFGHPVNLIIIQVEGFSNGMVDGIPLARASHFIGKLIGTGRIREHIGGEVGVIGSVPLPWSVRRDAIPQLNGDVSGNGIFDHIHNFKAEMLARPPIPTDVSQQFHEHPACCVEGLEFIAIAPKRFLDHDFHRVISRRSEGIVSGWGPVGHLRRKSLVVDNLQFLDAGCGNHHRGAVVTSSVPVNRLGLLGGTARNHITLGVKAVPIATVFQPFGGVTGVGGLNTFGQHFSPGNGNGPCLNRKNDLGMGAEVIPLADMGLPVCQMGFPAPETFSGHTGIQFDPIFVFIGQWDDPTKEKGDGAVEKGSPHLSPTQHQAGDTILSSRQLNVLGIGRVTHAGNKPGGIARSGHPPVGDQATELVGRGRVLRRADVIRIRDQAAVRTHHPGGDWHPSQALIVVERLVLLDFKRRHQGFLNGPLQGAQPGQCAKGDQTPDQACHLVEGS